LYCERGTDLFARSNVQRAVGVLRVGEEAVVVGLRGGAEAIMRHGEVEDEVAGASGILQVVDTYVDESTPRLGLCRGCLLDLRP